MKIKILCIGDSHTAGFPLFDPIYGGNHHSSYEYWLNLLLTNHFPVTSFVIDNKGICGQISSNIYQQLKINLSESDYHLVIFWGGANDLAMGYSVNEIWKNLWQAFKFTQEKLTALILVTIPPMNWQEVNLKIIQLNEKIRKNSSNKTYMYADAYNTLVLKKQGSLNPLYDAGDGVHLSIDGYEKVGKEIFNTASSSLTNLLQ
ncbi:MAG: GDSL-type esterase/lipase family protein [Candidatus Hodarchaeales archaeon]|jgi:lysophospholipase L1-like esterase